MPKMELQAADTSDKGETFADFSASTCTPAKHTPTKDQPILGKKIIDES